ncbi:hypothetical protein M514_22631 [Trichuris suis]|uniref:Uncharacterized protein n=1 Tax=Trichuris suis TaxID=68888 RepID=A0A085N6R0_9BILA|nr:hypothetical protein M514_22631 [Trichuris suis]
MWLALFSKSLKFRKEATSGTSKIDIEKYSNQNTSVAMEAPLARDYILLFSLYSGIQVIRNVHALEACVH